MERWNAEHVVARYDQLAGAAGNGPVDGQTWDDLLLGDYLQALAAPASLAGRQMLYRRLRRGQPQDAEGVRALLGDAPKRERLARLCQPLRQAQADVSAVLFDPEGRAGSPLPPPPRWAAWLPCLPLAFLASVAACFWSMPALAAALLLSLALMAVQIAFHQRMQCWAEVQEALQVQLYVHSRLDDAPDAVQAGHLRGRLARPAMSRIPGTVEYADWVMLANLRHYFASRRLVREHAAFLRASYERVAALEADLALAAHLRAQPHWCWAQEGWEREVHLQAVRHPLLTDAEALDLSLDASSAFITGQNGIGKSTLLRTVGLNLLVARAFGFCYAATARVPNLPVYASMRNDDALDGGESLYQSELRRAHELLAFARAPQRAVFIIDEIFRGTNHLESVSAAVAVLEQLAAQGTVLVSSHNVVMAQLLKACCLPLLVQRRGDRLVLTPGVLSDSNGLTLLAQRGFDAELTQRAREVYKRLSGRPLPAMQ